MNIMKRNLLIIEDDALWALKIEMMLESSNYSVLGVADTIEYAQEMIESLNPELIIADIKIQNSLIFTLITKDSYNKIPVIFMSAYHDEDIYQQSLEIKNSAFLVKPFHRLTLLSTLDLLATNLPAEAKTLPSFLVIRGRQQQIKKVPFEEIMWIQAEVNYSFIHTIDGKRHTRKRSLTKLMELIDERFIRIHKSYIINKNFVERIDLSRRLILIRGNQIPFGRGFREVLEPIINEKY